MELTSKICQPSKPEARIAYDRIDKTNGKITVQQGENTHVIKILVMSDEVAEKLAAINERSLLGRA